MAGTGIAPLFRNASWNLNCYRGKEHRESSLCANEAQALKVLKKRIGEASTGKLIGPNRGACFLRGLGGRTFDRLRGQPTAIDTIRLVVDETLEGVVRSRPG